MIPDLCDRVDRVTGCVTEMTLQQFYTQNNGKQQQQYENKTQNAKWAVVDSVYMW